MRLKLDERTVRELPLSSTKQTSYFDTKIPGFFVKTGKKTKTFCLQRAVKNRLTLVTIGRYPEFTVAKARIEAEKLAVLMKGGVNPNEERKALKRKASQTLEKVFESYRRDLKTKKKLSAYSEYMHPCCQTLHPKNSNQVDRERNSLNRLIPIEYLPHPSNQFVFVFLANGLNWASTKLDIADFGENSPLLLFLVCQTSEPSLQHADATLGRLNVSFVVLRIAFYSLMLSV
jgi:hypothetical protein